VLGKPCPRFGAAAPVGVVGSLKRMVIQASDVK
jgi:hypothetical protein